MLRLALPRSIDSVASQLPPDIEVAWYTDGSDCPHAAIDAEVLWLTMWRPDEITRCLLAGDSLRWVFTSDTGVDSFPLPLFRDRGVTLTNGRGLHAIPIAEYVVMAMLAAAKGFVALVRAQDRAEWLTQPPAFGELHGTRALIVGYGSIGRAVAERVRPFGVRVTGVKRHASEEEGVIGADSWRAGLPEYDWVILATPLTPATRHLVGRAELDAMRSNAWVMNVARGSVIDQRALESALHRGKIGGAYLDLTDPEPLPAESDLWHMPNVIVTPHSSQASSRTEERAVDLFLDNLARYRSDRALRNVVNLESGY